MNGPTRCSILVTDTEGRAIIEYDDAVIEWTGVTVDEDTSTEGVHLTLYPAYYRIFKGEL